MPRFRSARLAAEVRAVVQRVSSAQVLTGDRLLGEIGRGFVVLLGVHVEDGIETAVALAAKVAGLRIFEDAAGKMNNSLAEVDGSVLCVSQFTLYGDVRRGRRPSFEAAARPEVALPLYEAFCAAIERHALRCERGEFGASMQLELINDGPVTILLDSAELDRPRRA